MPAVLLSIKGTSEVSSTLQLGSSTTT